jgi:hypothetical protein
VLLRTINDGRCTNKAANVTAWGGSAYPWHSAHVISTLVVGFVALIAFAIYGK